MVPAMNRAALSLVALISACGHVAAEQAPAPEPMPRAAVHVDAVALELEIYEPHDGTVVAKPMVVAGLGSAAEVSTEFTLRPARRSVQRLDIEVTPKRIGQSVCEVDVRSAVLDDPRLRIPGPAKSTELPVGEWVDIVTLAPVRARARCSAPPGRLAAGRP